MEPNEHNCPICGLPLQIAKSRLTTEAGSTEIYTERKWVCTNSAIDPKTKNRICANYCGPDLNNPAVIAETELAIVEQ